jgi:transcriptional regulator with XRE-family HTH domain
MRKKKPGPPKGQKQTDVKRSPFGERLFRARKARGMSQEELGAKIGLSKRMVSRYEGTFGGPPMETLLKFANALKVTNSYLLGESPLKTVKDDIKPELRKYVETLQRLSRSDRKSILRMIELADQDNLKTEKQ